MMWYIYTMEYHTVIKMDEILPFVTTQMDLEDIRLSEITKAEKDKNHMISLICWILKWKKTNEQKSNRLMDTEVTGSYHGAVVGVGEWCGWGGKRGTKITVIM